MMMRTEGGGGIMIYPRVLCAAVVLALAGCASAPKVEYRVADVPEPPRIERPVLDSLNIDYSMPVEQIVQAMREDIKKLQAAILQYEKALDAYRKKDTK